MPFKAALMQMAVEGGRADAKHRVHHGTGLIERDGDRVYNAAVRRMKSSR